MSRQWAEAPPAPIPPKPEGVSDREHALIVVATRAKALRIAQAVSERAANRRGSLDAGATRASVTTANARWASAAEQRDRCQRDFIAALEHAGFITPEGEARQ